MISDWTAIYRRRGRGPHYWTADWCVCVATILMTRCSFRCSIWTKPSNGTDFGLPADQGVGSVAHHREGHVDYHITPQTAVSWKHPGIHLDDGFMRWQGIPNQANRVVYALGVACC